MRSKHEFNRTRFWSSLGLTVILSSAPLATPLFAAEEAVEAQAEAAPRANLADFLGTLFGAAAEAAPAGPVANLPGSTHKQIGDIKIRGVRSGHQLQTFCLNKEGVIFAVVAPPRPYGAKLEGKNNSAEIRVHDADGKELRQWSVDFAAQAIAAAPNGNIFVAGNGKIAKFDPEGKLLASSDAPHIAALLKNSAKLKEEAEAQLEEEKEQYEEQRKQLDVNVEAQRKQLAELKEKLDKVPEEERKAADKRKVRTLELQVKNLEAQNKAMLQYYKQRGERSVDDVIAETTSRLKIVNALTASDRDVFIASGVPKGYGYAIWRTSHEFEGADQIVSGLSGCCGQMDIRCCEDGVFVAENSRKRVLQYDREGKKLAQWGEGDRNGSTGAGFGGCCNPMNLCFGSAGEVFTAESEGYIKRFSKEGSFLGIVGQAKVSGGCKNVAIAVSPEGDKAYFFDLQGSRIVVLEKKGEEKSDEKGEEPKPTDNKPAEKKAALEQPAETVKTAKAVKAVKVIKTIDAVEPAVEETTAKKLTPR